MNHNKPGGTVVLPALFDTLKHTLKRLVLLLVLPAAISGLLVSCQPGKAGGRSAAKGNMLKKDRLLLDTVVSIQLYDSNRETVLDEAFNQMEAWENRLSRHVETSEISAINTALAGTAVEVSPEVFRVVRRAREFAQSSEGRFDPTIGPLVDLWDIGGRLPAVPDKEAIEKTLALVNYHNLETERNAVTLAQPGMSLDLGGIGKGWIADWTADFLRNAGERHILINLGGNILVRGGKPGGAPFRIGMQNPFDERGTYLGVFLVSNRAVVSSGIYERYFEADGVRYHHILDSRTGFPVENELAAVTVLTGNSMDGDALSTTLFALGLEDSLNYLASFQHTDGHAEAAFVTRDRRIILTPGAASIFEDGGVLPVEIRQLPRQPD